MIFDRHVNGPDNPGQIRYQDGQGTWQTIPVPEIVWVFQSVDRTEQDIPSDEPSRGYVPGNEHALYIANQDRSVRRFVLPEQDIELLYQDLYEASPKLILGALRGRRIPLETLQNCRDLGGIQNREGKFVIPHKLLRSDTLHPANRHDKDILEKQYDLKTVVDFRTDWERISDPDPLWLGVKHFHDPVFHESEVGLKKGESQRQELEDALKDPQEVMPALYEKMVLSETGIRAWQKFFEILLEDREGALLFQCTQGKDRTGVAAMLLLSALDVDEETILQDYMLNTEYLHAQMENVLQQLEKETGKPASDFETIDYLYEAKPELLQSALNAIKGKYGSVDAYLQEAVGLSPEKKQRLKDLYLCGPAQNAR